MALVSRRAYAEMRGVSEKAVRKAIGAGKIPLVDGMIDPEIADVAWSRNRDAGQQSKLADAIAANPGAVEAAGASTPTRDAAVAAPSVPQQQPALELAPLTQARIRATEESTAIREIQRRKLEGTLLESEEVERVWGEVLQTVKDRMRLIPDNVAPSLVLCNDEAEIRSILMREVMDALSVASKSVESMAAA